MFYAARSRFWLEVELRRSTCAVGRQAHRLRDDFVATATHSGRLHQCFPGQPRKYSARDRVFWTIRVFAGYTRLVPMGFHAPSDSERFGRVREMFVEAMSLAPAERALYLARAADTDPSLAAEVIGMLAADADPSATRALRDVAQGAATASTATSPPDQVGKYRILTTLGEGGMGTVYLAEQREPVRRRVALKVIKLGMDSKAVLARFDAERRALSLMDHSCIASVLDAGVSAQGQPYFVMEYVKGIPITDYCDQNRAGLQDRIVLFQKVCSGVQHAHMKGVMHRDLKPGNVLVALLDGRPLPKIIDFGLAKATDHHLIEATLFTERGVLIGTPEYTSPEQAQLGSLDIDTRTDIYSLGVLLYELLVGDLPFSRHVLRDGGLLAMQRVIREQDPPRPSTRITMLAALASPCAAARRLEVRELQQRLRGDLDWIVMKAMEKDRTRRYDTAAELAADLERHLRFEPVLASPPSVAYRLRKFLRRYRIQCIAAAAVLLAIVGGGIGTTLGFAEAKEQTRIAKENEARAREQERLAGARADQIIELARDSETRERAYSASLRQALLERDEERIASLLREEGALWPRRMEILQSFEDWLLRADEVLARRSEHEAALAAAAPDSPQQRTFGMILRAQPELRALRSVVQQRLEEACSVHKTSLADAGWTPCLEALRADARFAGIDLSPQPGLVPLGRNADSGLFEFCLIESGSRPDWEGSFLSGRIGSYEEQHGLVFVLLPRATFWLGTQHQPEHLAEYPISTFELEGCEATVSPFLVSKYELTQGQWLRMTGKNPSLYYAGTGNILPVITLLHPVEQISQIECNAILPKFGMRLPTEMEWEYACKGGTTTVWFTGDDPWSLDGFANVGDASRLAAGFDFMPTGAFAAAWFSDGYAHHAPVGTFKANPFGLHDILGNVEEWTSTPWGRYRNHVPESIFALSRRVVARGGSAASPPWYARSCDRSRHAEGESLGGLGGVRPAMDWR
jgi:serine/threonine protein kinase/formylglycine-generating enzyme required for sulfatase activity